MNTTTIDARHASSTSLDDLVAELAGQSGFANSEDELADCRLQCLRLPQADLVDAAAIAVYRKVHEARRARVRRTENDTMTAGRTRWRVSGTEERERERQFADRMRDTIAHYEAAEAVGWTDWLLRQRFSLPDGVRVTWGEATPAQHQARFDQLAMHASSTAVTATRHAQAIRDIVALSCENLNQAAGIS